MLLARRLAAATLVFVLSSGGFGLCAGWASTPEARMACCVGDDCPMHQAEGDSTGDASVITQAEADSCCAAAEDRESTPAGTSVKLLVSLAPAAGPVDLEVHPAQLDALLPPVLVPLPGSLVPRHLLLSVFLI